MILILSCPSERLKGSFIARLIDEVDDLAVYSVKESLYAMTHGLYAGLKGQPAPRWDAFLGKKQEPSEFFLGRKPWDCYEAVHEIVKALHGRTLLAAWTSYRVDRSSKKIRVIADLSNADEVEMFTRPVVVQLHHPDIQWVSGRIPSKEGHLHCNLDEDVRTWIRTNLVPKSER
jgi:hypothetical protein